MSIRVLLAVSLILLGGSPPTLAVDSLRDAVEFPVESSSGAKPWTVTTVASHDGVDSIRSGQINDNESSSVRVNIQGPGRLSFWWKVSSYGDENFLTVLVDGVEKVKISGEVDWEQRFLWLPGGLHQIEWTYAKGPFGPLRTDAAWLDQVEFHADAEGHPKVAQSITFPRREAATFSVELLATATSLLPVSYSVVEGPALMRGNIVTPTGEGPVRIRAAQPWNEIFAAAEPVEQNILVSGGLPNPLAADTPAFSIGRDVRPQSLVSRMVKYGTELIIAGGFRYVNGQPRSFLAKVSCEGSGALDSLWDPNPNQTVLDLAVSGTAHLPAAAGRGTISTPLSSTPSTRKTSFFTVRSARPCRCIPIVRREASRLRVRSRS